MPDFNRLKKASLDELMLEVRARQAEEAGFWEGPKEEREFGLLADGLLIQEVRAKQVAIYGDDDRQDVFELTSGSLAQDADCVVAIFHVRDIKNNGDGTSTLPNTSFAALSQVCSEERFSDQPGGAAGSGFLVAPDVIATAAHCIDTGALQTRRFVFGYRMRDARTPVLTISNDEIYTGKSIIARQPRGAEWALVRLDRRVIGHHIAPLRETGRINEGEPVHVVGHPRGLPAKVAGGAKVRDNSPAGFFRANLDVMGGNSGSPVFNSRSHVVEGIVVRGAEDFLRKGNCCVSLICPDTGCVGEDCTRTTEFARFIPRGNKDIFSLISELDVFKDMMSENAESARPMSEIRRWLALQRMVRSVHPARSRRTPGRERRELLVELETAGGVLVTTSVVLDATDTKGLRLADVRGA